MPFSIEIRPLAAMEIIEAFDWYELQREGLGAEFLNELENFYASLQLNPESYSYYIKPIRQGKIKRFPYVVVYEVSNLSIVIYSVFLTDRNPDFKRTK